MKLVSNVVPRRRVALDLSEPKITDQSYKAMCDINNIMLNYAKTGLFSHVNSQTPKYIDCTEIPNLETAFEKTQQAKQLFYELPADIRKLMDNNPANLEAFINDVNNAEMLYKYGLAVKPEAPKESEIQSLTKAINKFVDKGAQEVHHDKAI